MKLTFSNLNIYEDCKNEKSSNWDLFFTPFSQKKAFYSVTFLKSDTYYIQKTLQREKHYGECSLRDYEVYDFKTMKELVKMGLVKNYTGSRMAELNNDFIGGMEER